MPPLQGFIGPSYQAQAPVVNAEKLVNWYVEMRDAGTPRAATWFYATPCLASFLNAGTGPHRGGLAQNGRCFFISGTGYYEGFTDGSYTLRGTVVAGTDQGSQVTNGDGGLQNLVVVGGFGYVYDLNANTLTLIADVDFPQGSASMCEFLDGYGIVQIAGTAEFQISALEDFTDWDPLDIAQKSQTADRLVSIAADLDHKVLWLFGSQTTEIWWDSGNALFPFEPVPNSILSIGSGAKNGVVPAQAAMVWIVENSDGGRMAVSGVGATTKRISTHGVEAIWAGYNIVSDCIAWSYVWRGHAFCVFSFPDANATWVYDLLDAQWHEWLEWNQATGAFDQHLCVTHFYAFEKHLVGSRIDGNLYYLSAEVFTDNGTTVRRMRRSPHVTAGGLWTFCSRLRFYFQVGVGLTTGQGSNPQVMLRISRDGGRTWGTERWTTLGAIGAYVTQVIFRNNGRWRDGVIELTITDPVVAALTGCDADLEAAA